MQREFVSSPAAQTRTPQRYWISHRGFAALRGTFCSVSPHPQYPGNTHSGGWAGSAGDLHSVQTTGKGAAKKTILVPNDTPRCAFDPPLAHLSAVYPPHAHTPYTVLYLAPVLIRC